MEIKWNRVLVYLDITAPGTMLMAALIVLAFRGTRVTKVDFVLLIFFSCQAIINGYANWLQDNHINNHWLYHLNSLLTQSIFTFYFYKFFSQKKRKALVVQTFLLYLIFFATNLLFFQPYDTFNSYTYALGAILIVLYSLMNYYEWIEVVPTQNIIAIKEFWTSTGIMFYFGSSFFIFISYHYLSLVSKANVGVLWKIHNVFLALGCILFFKAITCRQWIIKS